MSSDPLNSTIPSNKVMADVNATNTIPVTSLLLREIARVTTEMTRIVVNATTESHVEFAAAAATTTTAKTTTQQQQTTTTTMRATTQPTWNSTRSTATTAAVAAGAASTTNKTCSTTTTVDPFDEFGPPEGVEYIFVPLGVMIFVIVLSAVVLIVSRRRKLERLRHRLMPLYNFDPGEEGEDDWETELLDEGFGSRQRRQGYQSMDSEENAELFGPH